MWYRWECGGGVRRRGRRWVNQVGGVGVELNASLVRVERGKSTLGGG